MIIANGLVIIFQLSLNWCDVKRYMNSQPDKEEAADTVLNASLPFLKSDEHERVKGQLSDIAQDMKEEQQQSRSRGLHL